MTEIIPRRADTDFLEVWIDLLPQGICWSTEPDTILHAFLKGMCGVWGEADGATGPSVDGRTCDLVNTEADPRTTIELLPEWESAFNLPDLCYAGEPMSVGDRQVALVARITGLGAQDAQYYVDAAKAIGYDIRIMSHSPFVTGISRVGDTSTPDGPSVNYRWELGGPELRQWFTVLILNPKLTRFRVGVSECGDPLLRIQSFKQLECMVNRMKAAHSVVNFDYSGLVNASAGFLAGTP